MASACSTSRWCVKSRKVCEERLRRSLCRSPRRRRQCRLPTGSRSRLHALAGSLWRSAGSASRTSGCPRALPRSAGRVGSPAAHLAAAPCRAKASARGASVVARPASAAQRLQRSRFVNAGTQHLILSGRAADARAVEVSLCRLMVQRSARSDSHLPLTTIGRRTCRLRSLP